MLPNCRIVERVVGDFLVTFAAGGLLR